MLKKIITLSLVALMIACLPAYAVTKYARNDSGFEEAIDAYPASRTSRATPAVLGMTVYSTNIQYKSDCYTEITLKELYSGKETAELAIKENFFNHEPKEGMQYIIARFNIRFQSKNHNDSLMLFADHFTVVTEKGNVLKRGISNLVAGFNTDDQIYSDAETIIDVPLLVPISDDRLLLTYWDAWFLIYNPPFVDPVSGISFDMSMDEAKEYMAQKYGASFYDAQTDATFTSIITRDINFLGRPCNLLYYINKSSDIVTNRQGTIYIFQRQNEEGTIDVYCDLLDQLIIFFGEPAEKYVQWDNEVEPKNIGEDEGINKGILALSHVWNIDNSTVYIGNITRDTIVTKMGTFLGLSGGEVGIIIAQN